MQFNFLVTMLLAALIPLVIGSLWYNPKTFGNAWMHACGFDEKKLQENFVWIVLFYEHFHRFRTKLNCHSSIRFFWNVATCDSRKQC